MVHRLKQIASSRNRGFVLVAFTLALLLIIGSAGLTFDIGKMYITRNESQSFCDAASIAATLKLNGTVAGIAAAKATALAIPKQYQFATSQFAAAPNVVKIEFSPDPPTSTSWEENPTSAGGLIMTRVTTTVGLPMSLMPALTGQFRATIGATATAKQIPIPGTMNRIFPFSPYWMPPGDTILPGGSVPPTGGDPYGMVPARLGPQSSEWEYDPADYHYQQGGIYTLRGPSNIDIGKPLIASDPKQNQMCMNDATIGGANYRSAEGQPDRGYINYNKSSKTIEQAILGNAPAPTGVSISIGDSVVNNCDFCLISGTRNTEVTAIQDRVGLDSNTTALNYKQYVEQGGNGARVVVVPITTGPCGLSLQPACPSYPIDSPNEALQGKTAGSNTVLGFAGFFLLPASSYEKNGTPPLCAEYIGPWVANGASSGAGSGGAFFVKLVQ